MPGTVTTFTAMLGDAGVEYQLLEHARTETAAEEAAALGLPPHDVAKTIVVATQKGNIRVLLPASERLDMQKLRELVGGGKDTHLLSEHDLQRDYPEFELGAVPPLGGRRGDRVIVDVRIADHDTVVLEAGVHNASVRLRTRDLIALVRAETADVCID